MKISSQNQSPRSDFSFESDDEFALCKSFKESAFSSALFLVAPQVECSNSEVWSDGEGVDYAWEAEVMDFNSEDDFNLEEQVCSLLTDSDNSEERKPKSRRGRRS